MLPTKQGETQMTKTLKTFAAATAVGLFTVLLVGAVGMALGFGSETVNLVGNMVGAFAFGLELGRRWF
jgi:hypothetical protein